MPKQSSIPHAVSSGIKNQSRILLGYFSNNPVWAMRAAENYLEAGNKSKAKHFYQKALERVNNSRDTVVLEKRHELQFRICHGLYQLGVEVADDPLFKCRVRPCKSSAGKPAGRYWTAMRPFGLKMKGEVALEGAACARPETIDIFLDGNLIRKERLYFQQNRASFSFMLKRSTLAHLPEQSEMVLKTSTGDHLLDNYHKTNKLLIEMPGGTGKIYEILNQNLLCKKGFFPLSAEEINQRQDAYLKLYEKARAVFDDMLERPLFLMYGTLLGLYRDGDFIPGDDDFDVGYVSEHRDPVSAKEEAEKLMIALIKAGFTVAINLRGKPFRLRDKDGDPNIHLDVRPIWYQDGRVWAHKQACLPLQLDDFKQVDTKFLRDTEVYIPSGTEAFLRSYYGENWKTPDPGFSNSSVSVPVKVMKNLQRNCFNPVELLKLKESIDKERSLNPEMGEFIAVGLQSLYPLSEFANKCGL
ncbi:MAG: LicD family protein [Firmicutes bacterium]|nr:LicD family protein [Bacillota bacterium]